MEIAGEQINNITQNQFDKLISLKELYEFWNTQINVISRKDMDQFHLHHVLHSLAIGKVFNFKGNPEVMDLGSGGGFPGIPLAICFPGVHFHLVDSIGKKIRVVREISQSLGLKNVTAEQVRAEDIKNKKFDCVVSRAVGSLQNLYRWSHGLINKKNPDAYGLICMKGGDLSEQISQVNAKVHVWEIYPSIFKNKWFEQKFILQIKDIK